MHRGQRAAFASAKLRTIYAIFYTIRAFLFKIIIGTIKESPVESEERLAQFRL